MTHARDPARPRRLVRQRTALDGSLVLAIPVALVAGLVSFFSPCVVPLLPGYLSYATGLSGADLADARRGRMLAGSLLFVLGFSFVFVSFGALFGAVGEWLFTYERQITVVLGMPDDPARPGLPRRGAVDAARLCGSTRCRRSGSPPRRCSACCSASAGRPASARR